MLCTLCKKETQVAITSKDGASVCVECSARRAPEGLKEKFSKWAKGKSLQDMLTIFLTNRLIRIADKDVWPSRINVNGCHYEFIFSVGSELDEDRGWWFLMVDPLVHSIMSSEEDMERIRKKLVKWS